MLHARNFIFYVLLFVCLVNCKKIAVPVDSAGGFSVEVEEKKWFSSSDIQIFCGEWYSVEEGTLLLQFQQVSQGIDSIGSFNETKTSFTLFGSSNTFQTIIKTYKQNNVIVFEQNFPDGCANCSLNDENKPLTHFPSLVHNKDIPLGFLHYSGYMGGWYWQSGLWPRTYSGGIQGGPIAWFDDEMNSTLILSSFTNFPIGIHAMATKRKLRPSHDVFAVGIEGKIEEIPKGFSYSSIMYCGEGLNQALMEWGNVLLHFYHKARPSPDSEVSTMIDYLGYSTTGYYFYNPLQGDPNTGNYQETLIALHNYNMRMEIPFSYYLLDSFWYGEHIYDNSVYLWEDNSDFLAERFPNGLQWLRTQLGVPIVAHLGKWSSTSPYVNVTEFKFITEERNGLALPQSVKFWDHLMRNASGWGLVTVKQDHMNEQVLYMNATLNRVDTVRNWLLQQGEGCARNGITIMYCMDFANVFMNSLELGSTATHSRASNDYVPDDAMKNWKIGVTGALLWSIGLYPYKDTFYSNTTECVVKPDAKFYNYTEPYPITHAVVSVLSTGPVAPSDGIGSANISLIMKTCRMDGLLLKPDRPSISIDRTWLEHAFGDRSRVEGPKGEVWTTYSDIGNFHARWTYFIGVNLLMDFNVYPSDSLKEGSYKNTQKQVAYIYDKNSLGKSVSEVVVFSEESPLLIKQGSNYGDFSYWIVCPEMVAGGPILLGELDKIVPVSRKRFIAIEVTSSDISFTMKGTPNEEIRFSVLQSLEVLDAISEFSCTISPSGFISFNYASKSCF